MTEPVLAPVMDAIKQMHMYPIDSLIGGELHSWFANEMKADIAVFNILGSSFVAVRLRLRRKADIPKMA
jgi:hypothetical protein